MQITNEKEPPLHLPFGPDAYYTIKERAGTDAEELEIWKAFTLSTDLEK